MKKRILSIILALAIALPSFIINASAEPEPHPDIHIGVIISYYDNLSDGSPVYTEDQGDQDPERDNRKFVTCSYNEDLENYILDISSYKADKVYNGNIYKFSSAFHIYEHSILDNNAVLSLSEDYEGFVVVKLLKYTAPVYIPSAPSVGTKFSDGTLNYYVTSSTTVKVNSIVNTNITNINIPSTVSCSGTTFSVTEIDALAFCGDTDLKSVKIPSSVTKIGNGSFDNCTSLKSVEIADGLTNIGSQAFYYCTSLTSITIPATLIKIGDKAFYGCYNLKNVEIKSSSLEIGHSAFFGMKSPVAFTGASTERYPDLIEARNNWQSDWSYNGKTYNSPVNAKITDAKGNLIFADTSELKLDKATDFMFSSSMLKGKDNRVFDPSVLVTSKDMQQMIGVTLNGGKAPTETSKYCWDKGYIEYCHDVGIVAGIGDGTLDPNSTFTGSEAAKMMLLALGYEFDEDLNKGIVDYNLVPDGYGKIYVPVGGVEIERTQKTPYASPVSIELKAKIPLGISNLLDMDKAELVHIIDEKTSETLKPEVSTEKSDSGVLMFGKVQAVSFSPFILLVPLKAEYSEIIDAAVKSIEKEDSAVSENPTTGVESNIFILAVTGLCALAVALKLGVKRED